MGDTSFLGSLAKTERDELIKSLHALQDGRCYISGEQIDLKVHEVDLDHIIAIARGGPDDRTNIGLALAHHNRSQGSARSLAGCGKTIFQRISDRQDWLHMSIIHLYCRATRLQPSFSAAC
jgi:hypothetical protein